MPTRQKNQPRDKKDNTPRDAGRRQDDFRMNRAPGYGPPGKENALKPETGETDQGTSRYASGDAGASPSTPEEEGTRIRDGMQSGSYLGPRNDSEGLQRSNGTDYSGASVGTKAQRPSRKDQPSTTRVEDEVRRRLERNEDVDATEIKIAVEDGEVTLTGIVTKESQRVAAEEAIQDVEGVVEIHNHLRVRE